MSISSWKEEFYIPVWNVPEGDESAAIAQSLQKFRGLRQEVLAKHGLTRIGSEGRMYPKIGELGGSWFDIDATSCALCDQYYPTFPGDDHGCAECPLYKELGNMTCDEDDAPYNVWYLRNDPEPMIEVLEKMLKDRSCVKGVDMPRPDQVNPHQKPWPDFEDWFKDQPETAAALSGEIAKLRDEIAALRSDLAPVPSLIVTGRQAIDEFKRLTNAQQN